MKFTKGFAARAAAAAVGSVLLMGTASVALAEDSHGDEDVDVLVDIAPVVEPGSLSLSVAGTSETLTEGVSADPALRVFEGTLPVVTVTDTRDAAEIGEGRWWYVLGQASEFVGQSGQASIPVGNFGWDPSLVDEGDGLVLEGDVVETVVDTGDDATGLVEQELLYGSFDSAQLVEAGGTSWSVTADLFLKTGIDVEPGAYQSVLTVSLFEDVY